MPEANELTLGIVALVAQAEREAISRSRKEALALAKARGVKRGNPNGAASLRRTGKGAVALRAACFGQRCRLCRRPGSSARGHSGSRAYVSARSRGGTGHTRDQDASRRTWGTSGPCAVPALPRPTWKALSSVLDWTATRFPVAKTSNVLDLAEAHLHQSLSGQSSLAPSAADEVNFCILL
jgi:hypothetical protein